MFFYLDELHKYWWFILRHEPRSKHVFEKNNTILQTDEDNEGDENKE